MNCSQSLQNSISDLQDYIDTCNINYQVIVVTETWLYHNQTNFFSLIQNNVHYCVRNNSNHKRVGDIVMYVHKNFDSSYIIHHDNSHSNNILMIKLQSIGINFCAIYRKSNTNIDRNGFNFLTKVNDLLDLHKYMYILGDFNINL